VNYHPDNLVWHYTTIKHYVKVSEAGYLLPSTRGDNPFERSILWFTSQPDFESTAEKRFRIDNYTRTLIIPDWFKSGEGKFRLGYPKDQLLTGSPLREASKTSQKTWKSYEKMAVRIGSQFDYWHGTTQCICIYDLVIEFMDVNGEWVRVNKDMPYTA